MRAWKQGVCVVVLGTALVLPAVGAEPEVPNPKVAPVASLWELVSDLWSGVTALWAPQTEEATTGPEAPGKLFATQCELTCGEQSHDIDPNG